MAKKEKDKRIEAFKMFKEIKTSINIANELTLIGDQNEDNIELIFSKDSPFYKIYGVLKKSSITENDLVDWLKTGKSVTLPLSFISDMASVTQKNIHDLKVENDEITFDFTVEKKKKDSPTIVRDINETFTNTKLKKEDILSDEGFNELEIKETYLESDVMKLYLIDNKITEDRTSDKLIEIASSKIKSLVKNGTNKIKFKSLETGRLVKIVSENDYLILVQEFRTI